MTHSKREVNSDCPIQTRAFLSSLADVKLPSLKAHLIFWLSFVFGLALDLWSKSAVFDWLGKKEIYSFSIIDGVFHLVRVENTGAAFGIAAGKSYLLIAASVVALVGIFGIFFFGQSRRSLMHFTLGLFTAGICGNLYDRIFNDGRVRDFIDIVIWPGKHWPAFNVADSLLCIGVGLLIIQTVFTEKPCRKRGRQHK